MVARRAHNPKVVGSNPTLCNHIQHSVIDNSTTMLYNTAYSKYCIERYMKTLIIGLALIATSVVAMATQEQLCTDLANRASVIQLKRQHREYNYVDRSDFISYQHHVLVNSDNNEHAKDMIREQYVYIADSVYHREYILNPAGMRVQVYNNCMLKNNWDYPGK